MSLLLERPCYKCPPADMGVIILRGHLSTRSHRRPLKHQKTHDFWPLDGRHLPKKGKKCGWKMKEEREGGREGRWEPGSEL